VIGRPWTLRHGAELQPGLQPELSAWESVPSRRLGGLTCLALCLLVP